jgi:hypothetical protein
MQLVSYHFGNTSWSNRFRGGFLWSKPRRSFFSLGFHNVIDVGPCLGGLQGKKVDAGRTGESGKAHQPPSTDHAGEGRREVPAPAGGDRAELAGVQSRPGLEAGTKRKAEADTGERSGADNNQPATVGAGGPEPGPGERTGPYENLLLPGPNDE